MPKNQASSDLPIIDWELGLKLAGNNRELAEEILSLFAKSLPDEFNGIFQAKSSNNTTELLIRLHRLRGGVSYTGLARLKHAITAYEKGVKDNATNKLSDLYMNFETEVTQALQQIGNKSE